MEYQTRPLAVRKSSTTFDEDAGLNGTKCRMKGIGPRNIDILMNVSISRRADHTAEQTLLHLQYWLCYIGEIISGV